MSKPHGLLQVRTIWHTATGQCERTCSLLFGYRLQLWQGGRLIIG